MKTFAQSLDVIKNHASYSEDECLSALKVAGSVKGNDIFRASDEVVRTIAKIASDDTRLNVRRAAIERTEKIVLAKGKQYMPELPDIVGAMLAVLKDNNPQNYWNPKGFTGSLFVNDLHKTHHMALLVLSAALMGHPKEASTVALRTGLRDYVRKLERNQNSRALFRHAEEQNIASAKKLLSFVQISVSSQNLGLPPSRKSFAKRSSAPKPPTRDLV